MKVEFVWPDPPDPRDELLVAVQKVWVQVSSDCDTVERTRTKTFPPETPLSELMIWASEGHPIGRGDVVLTKPEN